MWRRLGFIVATFAIALLLSIVNRGVFILYNYELAADYSVGELLLCFLHGLKLDASIAGYITALPVISTIVTLWQPEGWRSDRAWRRLHLAYFAVVVTLVALLETADIGAFGAWQSRIDAQVLIYSPKEMMASLTVGNAIGALCYVAATVAGGVWLYRRAVERWFMPQLTEEKMPRMVQLINTMILVLVAGVVFLVIRGGVTTATANVSKAHFSSDMQLNQIAVNPIFSFMESATAGDDFEQYDFFERAEAERLFAEVLTAEGGEMTALDGVWLNNRRPNIVLVIMEGYGRTMTDAYEGDQPVAPRINALKSEGIWFDRLYASSFRTDRGTVATLSGFPGQPIMSIMKLPNKASRLPGIAQSLYDEGYATRFIYGGDANFTNTRAYLYATGFQEIVDDSTLKLDGHRSKWGYADDALLDYASEAILSRIEAQEQPTFDVILTLSSHEPYEVPYERLNDARLNSFAFTDEAIGNFVDRLRSSEQWEDMLVILLPDHGTPYPANIGNNTPLRHHIPMLWLGGAVEQSFVVEECMAQTDLAATLLAQLGVTHDDFTFSRNIASPEASHFGYWAFNNGFGIIDSRGTTIYDCTTEQVVVSENDADNHRLNRGKAFLQKTFIEIREM